MMQYVRAVDDYNKNLQRGWLLHYTCTEGVQTCVSGWCKMLSTLI